MEAVQLRKDQGMLHSHPCCTISWAEPERSSWILHILWEELKASKVKPIPRLKRRS